MSYHDLSECTLSPAERILEAQKIIEMLLPHWDELRSNEIKMIEGLERSVSVKQLFWLRDIKDRVL